MRSKIVTCNNHEYKIVLQENDFTGLDELQIYKKSTVLHFFHVWKHVVGYWWIDHNGENPIDYALNIIQKKEQKEVVKTEYEKKLDEWFK